MDIKKTLLSILLAAQIGSCAILPSNKTSEMPRINYISKFKNDNSSLDDKLPNKAAQSVEIIATEATYSLKGKESLTPEKELEGKVRTMGSGTVVTENSENYYVLTAYHVVDLPPVISSSTAFNFKNNNIGRMLDIKLDENLKLKLTTKTATTTNIKPIVLAEMVGEPRISVGGVKGGRIVCYNENLDYAVLEVPNNGELSPLTDTKEVVIGNSDVLSATDYSYAIGYSLSLGRFVSVGNVSNKDLPLGTDGSASIKRTDAFTFTSPISPGNSGGPVFTIGDDNKMYLSGIAVAYFLHGQNLNIAMKINDILADIRRQNCLDKEVANKQSPVSYSKGDLK
jgi:S1-C subfamily serine protease